MEKLTMNDSIEYLAVVDMFLDSNEDFEPYGCSDTSETLERIDNRIPSYRAEFNDLEYACDE